MIVFFKDIEEANAFEASHASWHPISMCPGYITGSIFVMYKQATEISKVMASVYPSGKRKGRPPKIRPTV